MNASTAGAIHDGGAKRASVGEPGEIGTTGTGSDVEISCTRRINHSTPSTAAPTNPTSGRYKKRSAMMLPIVISRFDVGRNTTKKNRMKNAAALLFFAHSQIANANTPITTNAASNPVVL